MIVLAGCCFGTTGIGDLTFFTIASGKLGFFCSILVVFCNIYYLLRSPLICLVDLLFIILFYFLFYDLSLLYFSFLAAFGLNFVNCSFPLLILLCLFYWNLAGSGGALRVSTCYNLSSSSYWLAISKFSSF